MSGETESDVTGWTVDTLKYHVDDQYLAIHQRLDAMQGRLDERYHAQKEAVDKALATSEKAVDRRQDQLDKEFHEHLEQVRHENAIALRNIDKQTLAALTAQKEAVTKAEQAAEKRFESVNEFRAQLADQAATLMTRVEADAINQRNSERITDLNDRATKWITREEAQTAHDAMMSATRALQDRMNRMEGEDHGMALSRTSLYAAVGVIVAILGLIIIFANYTSNR